MRSSGVVMNQLSSQRNRQSAGGATSSTPTSLETGATAVSAARQKTEASNQGSLGLIVLLLLCNQPIRFAQESLNRAAFILYLRRDKDKSFVAINVLDPPSPHPHALQRPIVCARSTPPTSLA